MNNLQGDVIRVNVIPAILIFEILLLLPVRLLLRFRCVCKEWCELIDSLVFNNAYLALRRRRSMAVDVRLFILKATVTRDSFNCWFGDYQSFIASVPSSSSPSSSCRSNDFEIQGGRTALGLVNFINHVDGIICFIEDGDNFLPFSCKEEAPFNWLAITLVNPALREFTSVPIPPEFDLLGVMYKRRVQGVGIGYHGSNNEYKVVAIVTVFETEIDDYGSPYKHIGIVYHLSTNSWTILGDLSEFLSCKSFCHPQSVFFNGSLHWCVMSSSSVDDDETKKHHILAFDVTNESFRKIPFPTDNITSHHLLTVDKSTFALVENITLNVFDSAIQIWVMQEYGNTDSWSKRCLITNLQCFAATLCFLDQDKILLDLRRGGLISYDLSKGQPADEITTRESIFRYRPLISCHESFVSVKQV